MLLADDNADMRDYAARLLSERWDVRVASNGFEALELARTFQPDVIVTDVMMPELDGFELLRALSRARTAGLDSGSPSAVISSRRTADASKRTARARALAPPYGSNCR